MPNSSPRSDIQLGLRSVLGCLKPESCGRQVRSMLDPSSSRRSGRFARSLARSRMPSAASATAKTCLGLCIVTLCVAIGMFTGARVQRMLLQNDGITDPEVGMSCETTRAQTRVTSQDLTPPTCPCAHHFHRYPTATDEAVGASDAALVIVHCDEPNERIWSLIPGPQACSLPAPCTISRLPPLTQT